MAEKRKHKLLITTIWIAATSVSLALFSHPTTTPVIEDEIYWIGSSYYFDLAFMQRDWRNSDWDLLPACENPPIAKYAIGLGLALNGQRVSSIDTLGSFYAMFERVPHAWGEGAAYTKRERVVDRINPELREQIKVNNRINIDPAFLISARRVMIVCAAFTSFLILVFGTVLGHSAAGLIASQLVLLHPTVVDSYNHALSDVVALLFSTAAALISFLFIRRLSSCGKARLRKTLLFSLITGAALALACGAKINSLVVVFFFWTTLFTSVANSFRTLARLDFASLLGYGAATTICALAIFVLFNPAILHDPYGGLIACVREHRATEVIQAQFLPDHLSTIGAKVSAVLSLTYFGFIEFSVFIVAVVILCAAQARRNMRVVAWWWVVAFMCVTLWIPFPKMRYVLPLIVPSALLVANALVVGLDYLATRIRADFFSPSSTDPASPQ